VEKKLRYIHVMARSNFGTRIQLTLSEDTDDLRGLISVVLKKLSDFNTETEYYNIEHIDSISHLYDMDK
jgi:hypothetical protein